MGKNTKIRKKLSDYVNNATYLYYYTRLSLLAKTMFEYEGFPDSINTRYLEYCLFENGRAVIFEDPKLGLLCLKAHPTNLYNIYREPLEINAVGENGYNRYLKSKECVYVRNNDEEVPTREAIELFSYRLYDVERTADINVATQKMPYLMLCDEDQVLTMKNLYNKISLNEPAIFGVKSGLDLESVKIHDLKAPFVALELNDYKSEIWNEAMTYLGINNANIDKKERLITDEVNSNDEQIERSIHIMLKTREEMCEKVNKMFNLNTSVKLREFNKTELILNLPGGDNNVSENGLYNND